MIKYNELFNDSYFRIEKAANDFIKVIRTYGIIKEIRLCSVYIIVSREWFPSIINNDVVIRVKQMLKTIMHWDDANIVILDDIIKIKLAVNELGKDTRVYSNFCIADKNNACNMALRMLNAQYWFPEMVISTGMNNDINPYSYCAITEYMESNIVTTCDNAIMESPIPFGYIFATALYQQYSKEFPGVLVKRDNKKYTIMLMSESYIEKSNGSVLTGVKGFDFFFTPYFVCKED